MIFTLISKLWIFSKGIPYSTRINGTGSAEKVLSNTSFIVNAVCEGKSVGVVRVLTDKVTDAYGYGCIYNRCDHQSGFSRAGIRKVDNGM